MLILCSETIKQKISESIDFEILAKYTSKKKSLFGYIDMLEKSKTSRNILIFSENFKALKFDFLSLFTVVEASGGLIVTPEGEILFIYRRKKWDLPKGKIDSGETKKSAAIREVMEETGIQKVKLIKKLCTTNHTYVCKSKKRCIKKSYWYLMETHKQKLIPQKEEDIELAEWLSLKNFRNLKLDIYASIADVIKKAETKGYINIKKSLK